VVAVHPRMPAVSTPTAAESLAVLAAGAALMRKRDWAGAVRAYERAVEISPQAAKTQSDLAEAKSKLAASSAQAAPDGERVVCDGIITMKTEAATEIHSRFRSCHLRFLS
jgi:hypothetical protein